LSAFPLTRGAIKLAEFHKKNTSQAFLIELSLLSKGRKSHEIHILGGTDNMKNDTALAALNRTLSRVQKEKNPQLNLSLEFLESVRLKS